MFSLATPTGSLPTDDELFALLQANVKDYAIFVLDQAGTVVRWSYGAQRLLGYAEDEMVGQSFARLFTPDDLGALRPQHELQTAAATGRADDENWLLRQDGSRLWAAGSTTALRDEAGRLRAFVKIVNDLTERHRAERQLREQARLLHLSRDAFIVQDQDNTIRFWSEGAARLYGWSAEQALGRIAFALLHTQFPLSLADIQASLRTQHTWSGELLHTTRHGTQITVDSRWELLESDQTHSLTILEVNRDISERKALEQRKETFISLASHELKTPVTSLKGFTQILQRRAETRGDTEYPPILIKMEQQVDRINSLIQEILDVSRIQQGRLAFHHAVFPIDVFVQDIVEDLQQITSTHQIIIEGQTGQDVLADRDRLVQVLINLLTNAIKYSPEADTVCVRLTHESTTVTVSVQDFGIGIPPEEQEKVFERFYRAPEAENRRFPGLGLGLYISKEIVERLGGKIGIESTVGQGSTVSFTLPCAPAQSRG